MQAERRVADHSSLLRVVVVELDALVSSPSQGHSTRDQDKCSTESRVSLLYLTPWNHLMSFLDVDLIESMKKRRKNKIWEIEWENMSWKEMKDTKKEVDFRWRLGRMRFKLWGFKYMVLGRFGWVWSMYLYQYNWFRFGLWVQTSKTYRFDRLSNFEMR